MIGLAKRILQLFFQLLPHFSFILVLGLSALIFPAQVSAADFQAVTLTISSKTGPRQYNIALDQIGIVTDEAVKPEQVAALSDEFKRGNIQSFEGGFHIVKLPKSVDRRTLNIQAKVLRGYKLVRMAGPILYPDGYDSPMLLTDMIIVAFRANPDDSTVKKFAKANGLEAIDNDPLIPRMWVLRLRKDTEKDAVDVIQGILQHHSDAVEFAIPNFGLRIVSLQAGSGDPLFDKQWHHLNLGQCCGTFDADVDSELAWSITEGDAGTVIAILDKGFSVGHPDLLQNLWRNPGEDDTDANGIPKHNNNCDDDGKGFDDDLHGYNFTHCFWDGTCNPTTCPDNGVDQGEITENSHGTAVAGVAAAERGNGIGVSGMCPQCSLMLLQISSFILESSLASAITYPGLMEADILSNSWGYDPGIDIPDNIVLAVNATAAAGTIIFWSMNNEQVNDCVGHNADIHDHPGVISISAASNWDRKVTESGIGDCLGILAPAYGGKGPIEENSVQVGEDYTGSLNMVTTDLPGNAGYNDTEIPANSSYYHPSYCNFGSDTADKNYTLCFSGTSAATPVAAGVGGLVLSVSPDIDTLAMERLLQDTADKIEHSLANYGANTGKSNSDTTATPTHGYGRVNAFEAVKVVAPFTYNGQDLPGGTDIFIRDNELDWGNTAQLVENAPPWKAGSNVLMEKERGFIAHYKSVDIKVDTPDQMGNYRPSPTPMNFDSFTHENPISGALNKVYVRVHNRGPEPAENVKVKLHWAMAGTALPDLPGDFWNVWPADSSNQMKWHSLGLKEIQIVGYSGASVAGSSADGSQIVSFNFTAPPLDPSLQAFRHHCLFAVIDSPGDPVRESRLVPDQITPTNNNVTHRNMAVQDATMGSSSFGLMVRNPFSKTITTRIKLIKPKHWKVSLSRYGDGRPFEIGAGKEIPVMVEIVPDEKGVYGDVEIRQEVMFKKVFQPFGGFVYRFPGK